MKKTSMMIPLAMMGIGAGFLYTYSKKHPLKTKMLMNDVKNMMKDSQ